MNDIVDDSYQWSEPRDSKAPDLKPYADLAKALAEKDHAYQQLMEKAIRFAECLNDECKCTINDVNADPACAYVQVRVFLASPEVQAWKELT